MSRDRPLVALSARKSAAITFLALVLFQGFHELEHLVQVIQRFALGIANGAGIVGAYFDGPPLHFFYNTLFLALLVLTYARLGMHRRESRYDYGAPAFYLMAFALVFQSWHELEHVAKLVQYYQLNYNNAVGGILAIGPGGILPLFNNVWLHFWYNTIAYLPIAVAYFASGMPRHLGSDLGLARGSSAPS